MDINDEKKEISVKEIILEDKIENFMKVEVKVYFDKIGVCEIELLIF